MKSITIVVLALATLFWIGSKTWKASNDPDPAENSAEFVVEWSVGELEKAAAEKRITESVDVQETLSGRWCYNGGGYTASKNGAKSERVRFETCANPWQMESSTAVLKENGIDIHTLPKEEPESNRITQLFDAFGPIILLIAVWAGFMWITNARGRGGPMSFGKNKAKLLTEDKIKSTFDNVAGCDEAKDEVVELVDFLKDPQKYQRLGGNIPKGVLMLGPPGTGKTLLARAIAGEADVPFFSVSGSDFVEMFVGVGAARVRDMFAEAKARAPCIIFIDEIDAVGRQRGGSGFSSSNEEREQTLNQILVEMDGFIGNEGVIVIAATNRADVLDKALLRPGRFDRQVNIDLPDVRGREQILKVHIKKVPATDVNDDNLKHIAQRTPGFSGADLANLINEAALFAARANKGGVYMADLEKATDKIIMGVEKKSMFIPDKDKERTAWHEAGHCIIGNLLKGDGHDPVYKISIIPHGLALGITMFLPETDQRSLSKRQLESQIASLTGGRIAEVMLYKNKGLGIDNITTDASNDIERVTELARNMVTKWAMADDAPFVSLESGSGETFLGNASRSSHVHSGQTLEYIDTEYKKIITRNYQKAEKILKENEPILEQMAKALIDLETLDKDQIIRLMNGDSAQDLLAAAGNTSLKTMKQ